MQPFDAGIWAFLGTYFLCVMVLSFLLTLWGDEPAQAIFKAAVAGGFSAMAIVALQWWTPVVLGATWFFIVGWQAVLKRVGARRR